MPEEVAAQAEVELAGGIPFISDADLEEALATAGASAEVTQAVLEEIGEARLDGLRTALAALGPGKSRQGGEQAVTATTGTP